MESSIESSDSQQASNALGREVEQLGQQLAVRRSITLFAACFICAMASVMTVGLAVRLAVDSTRLPYAFWPAAVVGAGFVTASLVSAVKGRRLLRHEREQFQRYLELRSRAGLD